MNNIDLNDAKYEMAVGMLKAIAHPIRLKILQQLRDGEKLTVSKIYEGLMIEQATASHHLGILKDKGVLCSQRDGKNTLYFLKHKVLGQIIDCMEDCTCDDQNIQK